MASLGTVGSVLLLGSLGLLMGALSLTGKISTPVEGALWVLVGITWLVGGAYLGLSNPVPALLLVGLLAGLCTGALHSAFAETLVENNPGYAQNIEGPVEGSDRLQFLLVPVGIGLVWGLLFGVIGWGLAVTDVWAGWMA